MTLEEEQLKLIQNSLEEYARLRMLQTSGLPDTWAFSGEGFGKYEGDDFYLRCNLRNDIDILMNNMFDYIRSRVIRITGKPYYEKSKECLSAVDLWIGLRYADFVYLKAPDEKEKLKWTVLGHEPLRNGEYPLADIKLSYAEE